MSHELIYTSAPKGLKPGSKAGFTVVAMTTGMPAALAERLESLSGYRQVYPLGDVRFDENPVSHARFRVTIGGKVYDVVSRVSAAPADYSGRSNKLAHHVVLDSTEQPEAGPAWVMRQPDMMETRWEGEPRQLPRGRSVPKGTSAPRPCEAWRQACGDAGWAGVIGEAFLLGPEKTFVVVYQPGVDPLALVDEALALLPRELRWAVTFNTYFTDLPAGLTCTWRFCLAGTPAAMESSRTTPPERFLDLSVVPEAPSTAAVQSAREGRALPGLAAVMPRVPGQVAATGPMNVQRWATDKRPLTTAQHAAGKEPDSVPEPDDGISLHAMSEPDIERSRNARSTWFAAIAAGIAGLAVGVLGTLLLTSGGVGPVFKTELALAATRPGMGREASALDTTAPSMPQKFTMDDGASATPPLPKEQSTSPMSRKDGDVPKQPATQELRPEPKSMKDEQIGEVEGDVNSGRSTSRESREPGSGHQPESPPQPLPPTKPLALSPQSSPQIGTLTPGRSLQAVPDNEVIIDLTKYIDQNDRPTLSVSLPGDLPKFLRRVEVGEGTGFRIFLVEMDTLGMSERRVEIAGFELKDRVLRFRNRQENWSKLATLSEKQEGFDAELHLAERLRWAMLTVTVRGDKKIRVQPARAVWPKLGDGEVRDVKIKSASDAETRVLLPIERAIEAKLLDGARVELLSSDESNDPVPLGVPENLRDFRHSFQGDHTIPGEIPVTFDVEFIDPKNGPLAYVSFRGFARNYLLLEKLMSAADQAVHYPEPSVPKETRTNGKERDEKARAEKELQQWKNFHAAAEETRDRIGGQPGLLSRIRDKTYRFRVVMSNEVVLAEFGVRFKE